MAFPDEKILSAFEKTGKRLGEHDSKLIVLEDTMNDLEKQIKVMYRGRFNNPAKESPSGRFWANDEMAKEFGLLVRKAVGLSQKDMGEGDNSSGGYLVPESLASYLIDMMAKYGVFRANATVVRLGAAKQRIPRITSDLTIYCPGEAGAITPSNVGFDAINMTVKKFAALAVFSSELEEDSVVGLGEIIGQSIARSMAKKEDECGFNGDGTSDYFGELGIVHNLKNVSDNVAEIAGLQVGSGNTYAELVLNDFRAVTGRLPEQAVQGAKWYMSRKFFYDVVYPLAAAEGNAGIFEILSNKQERYLLGFPVVFTSVMPSTETNNQVVALLGDLSLGAYLGERRQFEIDRSKDAYFTSDLIAIRGIQRIDFNVFGVGDTTSAGPICGLITAAS